MRFEPNEIARSVAHLWNLSIGRAMLGLLAVLVESEPGRIAVRSMLQALYVGRGDAIQQHGTESRPEQEEERDDPGHRGRRPCTAHRPHEGARSPKLP
jgi:hypothetical protein